MRIKRMSGSKQKRVQVDLWNWLRSRAGLVRLLQAAMLCLAIVAVAGIWYKLEGSEMVNALLSHRLTRTDAKVDDLPALHFEVEPEAYQRMYKQWNESLRNKILQLDEQDWVQGQIRFRGERVPASLWLREEAVEHWQENKWSLQVKLQDDKTILGMRSFSAQSPAVRRYLDEWLYVQDLRGARILAPRYVFAHVWMNGDDWGVYALQERTSNASLASQNRTGGVIVCIDDSLFGRQRAWLDGALSGGRDSIGTASKRPGFARVDECNAAEVERDPALQEQSVAALGLLRAFQSKQLMPSQVFDAELMGRYIAHAHLWGARHGPRFEGERYYYHPLTSRLEPLGGDALPFESAYAHLPSLAQYDDLEIMNAYVQEVLEISQPEYLRSFQATYGDEFKRYRAALYREFPASKLTAPWRMLSERQAMLFSSLHPPQTVHAYCASHESSSTVDVRVGNLLMYPVVIDKVQVGDYAVDAQRDWIVDGDDALLYPEAVPSVVLRRVQETVPRYVTLQVPQSVLHDLSPQGGAFCSDTLQLVTHVVGVEEPVVVDVQGDYPPALSAPLLPVRPSVEQAIARHPFLTQSERPGFLELESGDWQVAGDLVLPHGFGLLASQPVSLRFDPGAVLFANGPLLLYGSADGRISLVPKEDDWGGIVVLDAGDEPASSLSYVTIRAAMGVQRDGWHLPGGVTFYESPVVLAHCRLLDAVAQAALHIVRTRFECTDTEFGYISDNALRGDFAEGRIERCTFHDVLGNALDVSGSHVDVRDVSLLRVYDQGISAGQSSIVTVQGVRAEDVGTVVASSDMSFVHVQDVHITQAWTAGLAAYTGEMGYGPASIQASGVVFQDDDAIQTLAQRGSSVRLDGIATDTREFNIEGLRWRQAITATIRALSYELGAAIRLVGYDLVTRELAPGDSLQVVLYWRTPGELDRDYTIFLHVQDASGQTVTGWDTMPRENAFPTTEWPAGKVIDDTHVVSLPSDIPPGEYHVALGMYY